MRKILKSIVLAAVLSTSMYAVNYEQEIAPTKKFITEQEQRNTNYQNFMWDQEKINNLQDQQNKSQEEFNVAQLELNKNQKTLNENMMYKIKSYVYEDLIGLKYKILNLESENDRLKSTINKLDSRLYIIERKVK